MGSNCNMAQANIEINFLLFETQLCVSLHAFKIKETGEKKNFGLVWICVISVSRIS